MNKIIFCLFLVLQLIWAVPVLSSERAIPSILAYQSVLYDDGGNLIPDGELSILFKIKDSTGQTLHEEKQTLNIVRGEISALLNVPDEVFDPVSTRYIETEAEGWAPQSPMIIASAPYAIYAGMALKVGDGVIDSRALADGGVAYEDLSADSISRLAGEILGGRSAGDLLLKSDIDSMYRTPQSATNVGVRPNFVYSAANNLQGVLEDVDRAVKRRDERINTEASERAASVSKEADERKQAIAAEAIERAASVSKEVDERKQAIAAEAGERAASISKEVDERKQAIAAEAGERAASISREVDERKQAIAAEASERVASVSKEVDERKQAIQAEASARNSQIQAETQTREKALQGELEARQQADSALNARIGGEESARASEDSGLRTADSNLRTADSNLSAAIAQGDGLLNARVDGIINNNINGAGGILQLIAGETAARESQMASESQQRSTHGHAGGGDGGSLAFGPANTDGAIFASSGIVSDDTYVAVPNSFAASECDIVTAFATAPAPSQADPYADRNISCQRACSEGNGYRIRCRHTDARCGNVMQNCALTSPPGAQGSAGCTASYLMFCIKKY